jgi:hypothetical protein
MKKKTSIVALLATYAILILAFFVVTNLRKAASPPPKVHHVHNMEKNLAYIDIDRVDKIHKKLVKIPKAEYLPKEELSEQSEGFSLPDVDLMDISVYVLLTLGLYAGKRWIDWYFKKKEIVLQHEIAEEPSNH